MLRSIYYTVLIACSTLGLALSVPAAATDNNAQPKLGFLATVSLTSSGRYVASLKVGTPSQTMPLLFDISQPSTWLRCADKTGAGAGNSYRPSDSSTYGTTKHPVTATIFNSSARLARDVFTLNKTDGRNPGRSDVRVKNQQFFCAEGKVQIPATAYPSANVPAPAENEVSDAAGAVGFGISGKRALTGLLWSRSAAGLAKRFAYCLSGTTGSPTPLFLGGSNYTLLPGIAINSLMGYLPLLKPSKKMAGIYRVGIRGIKVGDKDVALDPKVFRGGLEISTKEPYTKLVTPAYVAFRDAFRAAHSGIPRVDNVAPFDTCYDASGVGSTLLGPPVNPVSFTAGNNQTAFTFFGRNSMVFVKENVMCLGFLDAGQQPARNVLGSFQQLDKFVEFDLDNKRMGSTPLLHGIRTTCANFDFTRGSF